MVCRVGATSGCAEWVVGCRRAWRHRDPHTQAPANPPAGGVRRARAAVPVAGLGQPRSRAGRHRPPGAPLARLETRLVCWVSLTSRHTNPPPLVTSPTPRSAFGPLDGLLSSLIQAHQHPCHCATGASCVITPIPLPDHPRRPRSRLYLTHPPLRRRCNLKKAPSPTPPRQTCNRTRRCAARRSSLPRARWTCV